MSQQFYETVSREEELEDEHNSLPPHKWSDFAERMYDLADMRRKEQRENELINSLKETK